ncbi:MAG: hypothetical protein U0637_06325 [Phycisphaerales bacterium]
MRTTLSLVLLAGLATSAPADVPAALDRVPLDTPLVIAIDHVTAAKDSVERMASLMGPKMEGDEEGMLEPLQKLLALPGLAKDGSVAVLMYPKAGPAEEKQDATNDHGQDGMDPDTGVDKSDDKGGDKGDDEFFDADSAGASAQDMFEQFDMIALAPVTSAAEFAKGLGATLTGGRGECVIEGHQLFLRDIGAGHVALSPSKDSLDAFKPGDKQLTLHTKAIGAVGEAIARDDHVLIIANVPLMQDKVSQVMNQAGRDAGEEMGMPGVGQMLPMGRSMIDGMTKDATRMVLGAGSSDAGLWMDMAAQYREGSSTASMMEAKGNTSALLAKLPARSFIIAGAFDVSSPGVKKLMSSLLSTTGDAFEQPDKQARHNDAAKDDHAFQSPFSMIAQLPDLADGWGVVIGENPAGMQTGLLSQSVYCVQTRDAKAYLARMQEWNTATNGKQIDGVTYKSKYTPAAEDVNGVKADVWEVQTVADKDNPNAMMLNMTQQMLFGGTRMRGYAAPAGDSVVMTMSKSKSLLTSAVAAAEGKAEDGKSLASDKDILHAASFLPEGSAFQLFVNPKPLFQMAADMMDQVGGPAFEPPDRVSPVAVGAAMHAGGVHTRVFVPGDVLTAVAQITKSMQDAQAQLGLPADGKPDEGAPRF